MADSPERFRPFNIPERLLPGQNLFDQPPFPEALQLLPKGFFHPRFRSSEEPLLMLLRELAHFHNQTGTAFSTKAPATELVYDLCRRQKLVSKEYTQLSKLWQPLAEFDRFLFQFPYLDAYILSRRSAFERDGTPKQQHNTQPELTFAAFQHEQALLHNQAKWFGLEDELPRLATFESVGKAMPPKRPANRTYRLLVLSEGVK